MSMTVIYESNASISTTEYSLPNDAASTGTGVADDGPIFVFLDLTNLAAGDEFKVTIYEKVETAGSMIQGESFTFVGVQTTPMVMLPGLMFGISWDVTIIKVAGTDRTIGWSIRTP